MPAAPWLWPAPVLWLVLGAALLTLALLGIDTDGLILIGGITALLLTIATATLALPPLLAATLFAGISALGYGWLRRWARRQREAALPQSSLAEQAEVLSGFSGSHAGRVRWQGQSWAAVNLDPAKDLKPGMAVLVMGRDGTRLQVLPQER